MNLNRMFAMASALALAVLGFVPAPLPCQDDARLRAVNELFHPASGPDLSDHVSSDLEPGERSLMLTYMNALPQDLREQLAAMPAGTVSFAVVDGGTGLIHYNRPQDAGLYEVRPRIALPGNEHPLAEPEVKNPGVFGGSGPYRRIYTAPLAAAVINKADTGYPFTDYVQYGRVTTGCQAGSFAPRSLGFAYLGGWSGDWDTLPASLSKDAVLDAGLQYNLGASGNDDYALFINIGGVTISETTGARNQTPPHIMCGGVTALRFQVTAPVPQLMSLQPTCYKPSVYKGYYTNPGFTGPDPACTTYGLLVEAISDKFEGVSGQESRIVEWIAPAANQGGWASTVAFLGQWGTEENVTRYSVIAPCADCMFKWMTSIGQKGGENLENQSVYTATWSDLRLSGQAYSSHLSADLVPLRAANKYCTEYPLWVPPYGTPYSKDCKNSPSGLTGLAQSIKVTKYTNTAETDTIVLDY